ncbi:MAG: hypothetical protein EXQ81_11525 [Thermoleophilia bacterium]|nr:hypothetical protein [Thermoleophilia bacterium]
MTEVVEFTLHVKPGHYDEVASLYSDFVQDYLEINPALSTVLIVGDPAAGVVRGIGVYDTVADAAEVNSDHIFATFNDRIALLISGTPERVMLDLLHVWAKI